MKDMAADAQRLLREMEVTLAELDNVKDRLCAHTVELAMLRREMVDGVPFTGGMPDHRCDVIVGIDFAAGRIDAGSTGQSSIGQASAGPAFETHYHCGRFPGCGCEDGTRTGECPGRAHLKLVKEAEL